MPNMIPARSPTECHSLIWHPVVISLSVAVLSILSLALLIAGPSPHSESACVEHKESVEAARAVGAKVILTDPKAAQQFRAGC